MTEIKTIIVPAKEFKAYRREAENLRSITDYNLREAFVIAAGALDRAMSELDQGASHSDAGVTSPDSKTA